MTRRDMSPWQHQAIYNTKISGTHTWDLAEVMAGASPAEGQHLQACAVKGTCTHVCLLFRPLKGPPLPDRSPPSPSLRVTFRHQQLQLCTFALPSCHAASCYTHKHAPLYFKTHMSFEAAAAAAAGAGASPPGRACL